MNLCFTLKKKRHARNTNIFLIQQLPQFHSSQVYVKEIPFYKSQLERRQPSLVQGDLQWMGKGTGRAGHRSLILECAKMVKVCEQDLLLGVAGEFTILEKLRLHHKAKHKHSVYIMGSCKGMCCFYCVILCKATLIRM